MLNRRTEEGYWNIVLHTASHDEKVVRAARWLGTGEADVPLSVIDAYFANDAIVVDIMHHYGLDEAEARLALEMAEDRIYETV